MIKDVISTMSITTTERTADNLRFQVGTSGFMTSKKQWLKCKSMNCIELNSSFYRIPSDAVINNLCKLPKHVKIICKVSKYITHIKRLKDIDEAFQIFWNQVSKLGERLTCILFQFPPSFIENSVNIARLNQLHTIIPKVNVAIEFRDASWLNTKTYDLFRNLEWCIVGTLINKRSTTKWVGTMPNGLFIPPRTCNLSYLRIHGKKGWKGEITSNQMQEIRNELLKQKVKMSYVMFNNTFFDKKATCKNVNGETIKFAAVYDATVFASEIINKKA